MPTTNAYLIFNGNCGEAMRFYAQVLNAKLDLMTFKDAPIPPEHKQPGTEDRVMHARLDVPGGAAIMASDDQPGVDYAGMKNVFVSLGYTDIAEGKRVFEALSEAGDVTMPFGSTFWSPGFGMCRDRFGTNWMVNVETKEPQVSA